MSGVPVKNFSAFVKSFNGLSNDASILASIFSEWKEKNLIDYKYTWDNYQIFVTVTPQKIIDIKEPGNYEILIANPAKGDISLYLGDDGDEMLTLQNSGWKLSGKGIKIREGECTIWGVSANDSILLSVTIHSEKPNFNKSEKMPNPLMALHNCTSQRVGNAIYSRLQTCLLSYRLI